MPRTRWLWMLALALVACNLSATPPTPTVAPIPTQAPLRVFPTLDATPLTNTLPDGQTCLVPPGWSAYTVEPGDSLTLLADQTNSTIDELVAGNCLANPDQIDVGQVIYLPRQPVIR